MQLLFLTHTHKRMNRRTQTGIIIETQSSGRNGECYYKCWEPSKQHTQLSLLTIFKRDLCSCSAQLYMYMYTALPCTTLAHLQLRSAQHEYFLPAPMHAAVPPIVLLSVQIL